MILRLFYVPDSDRSNSLEKMSQTNPKHMSWPFNVCVNLPQANSEHMSWPLTACVNRTKNIVTGIWTRVYHLVALTLDISPTPRRWLLLLLLLCVFHYTRLQVNPMWFPVHTLLWGWGMLRQRDVVRSGSSWSKPARRCPVPRSASTNCFLGNEWHIVAKQLLRPHIAARQRVANYRRILKIGANVQRTKLRDPGHTKQLFGKNIQIDYIKLVYKTEQLR